MKMLFIRMFMTAAAVETATDVVVEPVLTSENLTKLQADYATAWAEMLKHPNPSTKEAKDAKLAVWKVEKLIQEEENAIRKTIADQKTAEQRNARLALNTAQFAAYDSLLVVRANKKSTTEDIAAAELAFNTAKEAVDNELLAKYAASRPAKAKTETGDKPAGDADSDAKKAAIIELFLAGKTQKEIEAAGYARSTVWHTIDKYKKANGLTK